MRYAYTLTTTLPASADDIYDAWVDSRAHSEMTGAEATQSDEIGAAVSAWGDYISGRNLELVPGERIVQTWRTQDFTDAHEDSVITVTLEKVAEGTLLKLVHSNVPKEQTSYERGGWQEHYFEPMQEYFGKRAGGKKKAAAPKAAAPKAKARAKTKAKAAPKAKAAKKKVRGIAKAKPKAKAKSAKKAKGKAAKRKGRK